MDFLKRAGKMDSFEIRNSTLIILLIAPGLLIYSLIIGFLRPGNIEIVWARELFSVFFLIVGLIPLFQHAWCRKHYAHLVFITMTLFSHYLIYTSALNTFSLDYLLGTYVVLFGGILLLTNRIHLILFTLSALIHVAFSMRRLDMPIADEGAVIVSVATIFIFSFIIQNSFIRYTATLKRENFGLERKVDLRTNDLKRRAKELSLKNRELEEFAYVVSHDLKRPMRNAYSLASWAKEDLTSSQYDSAHDNLVLVMEQLAQMDLLVNGILEYSLGIEKKKAEKELNLDKLVDTLIATNTTGNVVITKDVSLPNLYIDEAQMLQVFQNLVQNAIRYNDKSVAQINIGFTETRNCFTFYVRDNGMGIEKQHQDRIFKLFQKLNVDSNKDSSGIGLAVVKKIVDKNGGEVYLESEIGEGATFYVTLFKDDVLKPGIEPSDTLVSDIIDA